MFMEAKDINDAGAKRQQSKPAASRKGAAKAARKSNPAKSGEPQKKEGIGRQTLAIIAIVIIFAAVFSSLFYGLISYKPTSFSAFASNFNKASSVAICSPVRYMGCCVDIYRDEWIARSEELVHAVRIVHCIAARYYIALVGTL